MIDITRLPKDFIQRYGSCVLSSYAVVARYYTGSGSLNDFYQDYLSSFSLPVTTNPEKEVVEHFDAEWQRRQVLGYQVILDLHNCSKEATFSCARQHFNAELIKSVNAQWPRIQQKLEAENCLLNLTYQAGQQVVNSIKRIEMHSVTIGMRTNQQFVLVDTNSVGIRFLNCIGEISGDRKDGVLYTPLEET